MTQATRCVDINFSSACVTPGEFYSAGHDLRAQKAISNRVSKITRFGCGGLNL